MALEDYLSPVNIVTYDQISIYCWPITTKPMRILFKTERLILRRFTETDCDNLYELDNDPEVMRYINGGTATPLNFIQENSLPLFTYYDHSHASFGFWAAIEKVSSKFLGWFCLRPVSNSAHQATIGYRLHKSAWGNGYATEGSRALIHEGFTNPELHLITATTYEHNKASIRVMEKSGLSFVRSFRLDLANQETAHFTSVDPWDGEDVEYSIERADWHILNP